MWKQASNLSMNVAQVRIWDKTSTAKNPEKLVLAFVCSSEDTGTWERSMKAKGCRCNTLASRDMNAEEIERESKTSRLHFMYYNDWIGLITDEWRVTESREWIAELLKVSKEKYTVDEIIEKSK